MRVQLGRNYQLLGDGETVEVPAQSLAVAQAWAANPEAFWQLVHFLEAKFAPQRDKRLADWLAASPVVLSLIHI